MSWEAEKEEIARDLAPRLYEGQFIETIYNARDEKKRKNGWLLKSGPWSPWFLNLRPIGDEPRLLADIGYALALVFENEMPECNKIVGVEMAGIPIAVATSIVNLERRGFELPFCYTRPLPGKARTPEEAEEMLKTYGGKELVEGRINSGENLAIWDDMVTNFGSKEIARSIVMYEVGRKGLKDVKCDHAAVLLDREQGAEEQAKKLGRKLHSVIPFKTKGLGWLKDVMDTREFELITDYQGNVMKYQDEEVQKRVLNY
jgi:orotate phosphoribosyltransferase